MIALILSLVQEAVTLTPGIVEDLKLIFNNPSPTPADWEALRAKVLSKSYADFVPASALPALAASKPVVLPDPAPVAAETVTAAPETKEQAAAAPAPYLPDGSKNPDFVE